MGTESPTSNRFHAIISEADEGVIVLEPSGVVSFANPAAEFLLGRERIELVGEMFGLPLSPTRDRVRIDVLSSDGAMRLVELAVETLPLEPPGTLVLRLHDVTDYHRDVVDAKNQVRRRDEFLAMLSHEIRNPLAAIHYASTLLTAESCPDHLRRDAGSVLQRQFEHLGRILDDLLDISRINQGKLVITKVRVDLGRVLKDVAAAVRPLIVSRGHTFDACIPEAPQWILGDATRLEQIVVNLLNNAAKFTPAGGIVRLSATPVGDEIEIRTRDNGPGIADDLLPHIFEPFVQGRQLLDRKDGGLGIGLMLVRTFVSLHEGTIGVESNAPEPGVTFVVRLPLAPPETPARDNERFNDAAKAEKLRILLVEDNDDARTMLRLLLQTQGHLVAEAANGADGLAMVIDQEPDVALVDIGLPKLNGLELARRVQAASPRPRSRLIALSGYGMPEDVREALAAGFDGHLVKPVQFTELQRRLDEFRQTARH